MSASYKCFDNGTELSLAVALYLNHSDYYFEALQDLYGNQIGDWCVDKVQDFYGIFANQFDFNEDLSRWNVSNALDMTDLFVGCHVFNQPLETWDVSKVQSFRSTFGQCHAFDQSLQSWDTGSVVDVSYMFYDAVSFHQPLNHFQVDRVTDFSYFLFGAESFDHSLSSWNTSSALDMSFMFKDAKSFDQPLNHFQTHKVSTFESMFEGADSFNQDISDWNILSARNINFMFTNATSFHQNLCAWGRESHKLATFLTSSRTMDIFFGSSCPNQHDPIFTDRPPGPFCVNCYEPDHFEDVDIAETLNNNNQGGTGNDDVAAAENDVTIKNSLPMTTITGINEAPKTIMANETEQQQPQQQQQGVSTLSPATTTLGEATPSSSWSTFSFTIGVVVMSWIFLMFLWSKRREQQGSRTQQQQLT